MIMQQKALDQSFKTDPRSIVFDVNGFMEKQAAAQAAAAARVAAALQVEAAAAVKLKAEEDGGEVFGGGTDFAAGDGGNWRTHMKTQRRRSSGHWDEASGRRRRDGGFDERPTASGYWDETSGRRRRDGGFDERPTAMSTDNDAADAGGDAGWRTQLTTQRRRTSGYWNEASGRRHRIGAFDERPSSGGIGLASSNISPSSSTARS